MITFAFIIFSLFGILFAYYLKVVLSSKTLGYAKFFLGLAINMFFMRAHMNIVKFDNFLYFGHHPEIINNCESVGWLAFICLFLHALAFPVKRDLKWWWQRLPGKSQR
ncbi:MULTISPECIES: hypothetical protein [unclassified Pseudomonas]|uniref:hypothetical protein n=1 Tax=unclassified Pseudomonas TaxID=196821 RepID=UPI0030CB627A